MDYKWTDLNEEAKNKLYCYLYPTKEECLDQFAKELGVDARDLKDVGELCNAPDLDRETFKHQPFKQKIDINGQSASKD